MYLQEMKEAFASIQIEDEEQGGLNYENNAEDIREIYTRWCLVGRFLTDLNIDFQVMRHKMAALWRPGREVYVKQLDSNRFIFQFYYDVDIKRVMEESPWTFDCFYRVLYRLKEGDNLRTVEINNINLWVQRLEAGDENTKYFHASCSKRKRNNHILRLKYEEGEWIDCNEGLGDMIRSYF